MFFFSVQVYILAKWSENHLSFLCEVLYNFADTPAASHTCSRFVVTPNPGVCHSRWESQRRRCSAERLSLASLLPVAMWPIDLWLDSSLTVVSSFLLKFFKMTENSHAFVVFQKGTFWNHGLNASVMVQCYIKVPTLQNLKSSMWHFQIAHLPNTHGPVWKASYSNWQVHIFTADISAKCLTVWFGNRLPTPPRYI